MTRKNGENFGRWFMACPKERHEQCPNQFRWRDDIDRGDPDNWLGSQQQQQPQSKQEEWIGVADTSTPFTKAQHVDEPPRKRMRLDLEQTSNTTVLEEELKQSMDKVHEVQEQSFRELGRVQGDILVGLMQLRKYMEETLEKILVLQKNQSKAVTELRQASQGKVNASVLNKNSSIPVSKEIEI